jgi:Ca2+-binding EF-hand superfamily protein
MKRTTLLALGLAIAGAAPVLLAQTAPGTAPAGRPAAGQPGQPGHHPKLDANGDGVIDRAEAAKSPRFAGMFDKFDANHDGKLTADERPQHRGRGEGRDGRGGDRLAELDANGDGAIDRAEAAKAPRLSEHFDKLDANHDGRISAEERPKGHGGRHGPGGPGGDRGQRMAQLDKNGDGKFSRDELAGHERALSHFVDIDANKDGFVTHEEMKAYHQAHRGERGPRSPQGAAPTR